MATGIWAALAARKEPTVKTETQLRAMVVQIATAQLGRGDPAPYWEDAFGTGWASSLSWCGVFALWVLRQAGLTDAKWITGKGFIYPLKLRQTTTPEPGDIAYFEKFQHQAIVAGRNFDGTGTVRLINGNGEGGKVTESNVQLDKVTAFFSIDSLIAKVVDR